MKKLMMVALCALGANVSMAEVIYRVQIDDLYYNLDDETLTAEVANPGDAAYSLTNVEIPECVIYEGESYAVTAIGGSAFSKYGSPSPLESVSAPFVTSIGSGAFRFCSSLKSVYAPRVTSIEDSAFGHCTSLALLTVYSSMKDGWDSNKGNYGIGGDFSVNPQVDFATVPKLMPRQVAQAKWEATVTVSSTALKSGGETLDKAEYENACEFYGVEAKQEPTAEDYKFVPSGSVVVPEEQVIPEGYKAVPQNAQIVPTGYIAVKPEQVIPEGSVAVKPEQVIPEGSVAVKPEQVIPEGYKAVPQGARVIPEGEPLPFAIVEYRDAEGKMRTASNVAVVGPHLGQTLKSGWYVVCGTNELGSLTVEGEVNLILCDGAKLTVTGGENQAGIAVTNGNALTIWGQSLGTGELVATGGAGAAGIGGNYKEDGGTVTINGGTVTTTGGHDAAGIGSGNYSGSATQGTFAITINGGRVRTEGIACGAGLGGGWGHHGGQLVINGGTIAAIGGWSGGASLGDHGGLPDPLMSVEINGGCIKADLSRINTQPMNGANAAVWCVTVELGIGNGEQGMGNRLGVEGLEGYGTRDICPIDGKAYLWLPNGTHEFTIDGVKYRAVVQGAATTAIATGVPPAGAVMTWTALTNAVATAAAGAEIAVGADITEANGELVVPKGKEVAIKLYGKTVSCGSVMVGGALTVGDAEDLVGKIVATDGAKITSSGLVTLLGGPVRGTFTTQNAGLIFVVR